MPSQFHVASVSVTEKHIAE